jgi:hypothetical protein
MIAKYRKYVKQGAQEWEQSVKDNKELSITPSDKKAAVLAKKLGLYE